MKVIHNSKNIDSTKEVYQCANCNNIFHWVKDDSCWYGSLKQMDDNPDKIKYYCTEKCYLKQLSKTE